MRVVVLDSGPLGMVTNPTASAINHQARLWLEGLLRSGVDVVLPEIADYEVRRKLLLHDKLGGLRRLDILKESPTITFLPITTSVMLLAARYWATARRSGRPTADRFALDADAILAAQAVTYRTEAMDLVVATENVRHIGQFAPVHEWSNID